MDYYSFMLDCISRLKNEDIILRSPRGKAAKCLLEYIEENLVEESILKMMAMLMSNMYLCFTKAACEQASSIRAQGNMWRCFHILRTDSALKSAWDSVAFPDPLRQESALTFQLLCDRFLKAMIANKSSSQQQSKVSSTSNTKLSPREQNAVRYMAGYVAVSLLNRYKKLNKRKSQGQYTYFISVLESMKADRQDEGVVSIEEYTRYWSELIDRGGLYHINDKVLCIKKFMHVPNTGTVVTIVQVFELIQMIEIITRSCLLESAMSNSAHTIDISSKIRKATLESPFILQLWKLVSPCEPSKDLSVSLLREIIDLWISIRGHSFARDWAMNFASKSKKGL